MLLALKKVNEVDPYGLMSQPETVEPEVPVAPLTTFR